jgi:hypothetical protein
MPPSSGPARPRRGRVFVALAVVAVATASAACGDDPFAIRWVETPDTVTLFSLSRPELNLPSGFDFRGRAAVVVESPRSTGSWDVAVDTRDGRIVLLPAAALGVDSRAAVAPIPDMTYDELVEAPADTSRYVQNEPVPVDLGSVYVIRTRRTPGSFGSRCFYYAKMQPLSADVEVGTFTFFYDAARVCNDRRLIPPD